MFKIPGEVLRALNENIYTSPCHLQKKEELASAKNKVTL